MLILTSRVCKVYKQFKHHQSAVVLLDCTIWTINLLFEYNFGFCSSARFTIPNTIIYITVINKLEGFMHSQIIFCCTFTIRSFISCVGSVGESILIIGSVGAGLYSNFSSLILSFRVPVEIADYVRCKRLAIYTEKCGNRKWCRACV